MPITINGTGSITGISAGGLPDACITTDDLAANAVTTAKMGTSEASGLAKAWVNFNGTGTVAIRASSNVSSITDNGQADYTINFTTALVDANYCITANASVFVANRVGAIVGINSTTSWADFTPTTSAFRIALGDDRSVTYDPTFVCVVVHR